MPALFHTFLLTLAIAAAYWWVSVPELNMYSLQAIAGVMLLYFLLKRVAKAKYWHVMPAALTIETALVTFAFLILIGSTGNTSSILFPLSYVHLFLIAFSSEPLTSIVATVAIVLFHYALTAVIGSSQVVTLLSLPLIMIFFLFAERQHEEVVRDRIIIAQETSELSALQTSDSQLHALIDQIQNHLLMMGGQLRLPITGNTTTLQEQLTMAEMEITQLQEYLKKRWFMFTNSEQTGPDQPKVS